MRLTFVTTLIVIGLLTLTTARQQPAPVRDVTISAIPGVIAANAKWTLVWAGADNADGLVGSADGGVLFAQEQPKRVSKIDRNDKVSVFVENTHGAGALNGLLRRRVSRVALPRAAPRFSIS